MVEKCNSLQHYFGGFNFGNLLSFDATIVELIVTIQQDCFKTRHSVCTYYAQQLKYNWLTNVLNQPSFLPERCSTSSEYRTGTRDA